MSITSPYLTVAEVAERLGRDPSTVCRYIRRGLLPAELRAGVYFLRPGVVRRFKCPLPGNPNFLKKTLSS